MTNFKLSVIFASLLAMSAPAWTAPVCSQHDSMVKLLGNRYKEALSQYGISGQTNLVEIYVSKAGTFTIIATRSDGISCIVATGDSWENQLKNLTSL
jgi:hypothetical protein